MPIYTPEDVQSPMQSPMQSPERKQAKTLEEACQIGREDYMVIGKDVELYFDGDVWSLSPIDSLNEDQDRMQDRMIERQRAESGQDLDGITAIENLILQNRNLENLILQNRNLNEQRNDILRHAQSLQLDVEEQQRR